MITAEEDVVTQVGIKCRLERIHTAATTHTKMRGPTQGSVVHLSCRVKGTSSLEQVINWPLSSHQQHGIDSQPPARLSITGAQSNDSTDAIERRPVFNGIAEDRSTREQQPEVLVSYTIASHVDLARNIASIGHLGHFLCLPSPTLHAWRQISEASVGALRALWPG